MPDQRPPDLNDLLKRGVDLAAIIDAALAETPDSVKGESARLAAQRRSVELARETLSTLAREVSTAQDQPDQKEAIRRVMSSAGLVSALATLSRIEPTFYLIGMDRLSDERGLKSTVSKLELLIRAEAGRQVETVAEADIVNGSTGEVSDLVVKLKAPSLPAGMVEPDGWRVDGRGIWLSRGESWIRIAPAPILIRGLATDIDTGETVYELTWKHGRTWYDRLVDADIVAEARKIPTLKAWKAPVTSASAKDVVRFLEAYEAANIERLPESRTTSRLGWLSGGDDGFLFGCDQIGGTGDISLRCSDEYRAIASSIRVAGRRERWIRMTGYLDNKPLPWIAIYGAVASLLLQIIGCKPFWIDFSGVSSTGKSLSAKIAASLYGDPSDGSALIGRWHDSEVAIENRAAFQGAIPLFLDESQTAGRSAVEAESKIRSVVHAITGGSTRGRGALQGQIQATRPISLVGISTGEERLTSWTQAGGVAARIISVEGPPLGEQSIENAEIAAKIEESINDSHGHIGRELVEYLIERSFKWERLGERYRHYVAKSQATATGTGFRLSEYLGALMLAESILHDSLKVPRPSCNVIAELIYAGESSAKQGDKATESLLEVYSWCLANSSDFYGRHSEILDADKRPIPRQPVRGWAGSWEADPLWDRICLRSSVLKSILEGLGYRYGSVIKAWHMRGWLVSGPNRHDHSFRLLDQTTKGIVVRRGAVDAVLAAASDEGDES